MSLFYILLSILLLGTIDQLQAGTAQAPKSALWVREGANNELISPAMKAAKEGDIERLKSLSKHNVRELQKKSASFKTPLHYAIECEQAETARYLIEKGADINALDADENTPLSLARSKNMQSVIDLLEDAFLKGNHFGKNFDNQDKHFVILVASYNNEQWYEKNLLSILNQDYRKYTVIYMNDQSKDKTKSLVKQMIRKYNKERQFIFIDNKVKRYCLGNYLFAIERFCPQNSVLVTLDGDDWFPEDDKRVLSYLNAIYKNPAIWLTYGSSVTYPNNEVPYCKPINFYTLKNGTFREQCKEDLVWPVHHLRSFYTWLFRKIKYEDFLDENNELFTYVEDAAFMMAMIEMCGYKHHKYLSKKLYIYNQKNPLVTKRVVGDEKIKRKFLVVCNKKPYAPLDT